jgi:hypothetical protein
MAYNWVTKIDVNKSKLNGYFSGVGSPAKIVDIKEHK